MLLLLRRKEKGNKEENGRGKLPGAKTAFFLKEDMKR
jgi:hypothetical protein